MRTGAVDFPGTAHYDALRGDGLDFLILDEYASIAKAASPEVLRPALADKQGHALFIPKPITSKVYTIPSKTHCALVGAPIADSSLTV